MTPAPERVARIREQLTLALQPTAIEVIDDSDRHIGHAGALSGGGHYTVHIVSGRFTGKALLERHRMVYDALRDMMHVDIHALSIQARSPEERSAAND